VRLARSKYMCGYWLVEFVANYALTLRQSGATCLARSKKNYVHGETPSGFLDFCVCREQKEEQSEGTDASLFL
jgi:hypothetical protein